jgi:hypothetical protein
MTSSRRRFPKRGWRPRYSGLLGVLCGQIVPRLQSRCAKPVHYRAIGSRAALKPLYDRLRPRRLLAKLLRPDKRRAHRDPEREERGIESVWLLAFFFQNKQVGNVYDAQAHARGLHDAGGPRLRRNRRQRVGKFAALVDRPRNAWIQWPGKPPSHENSRTNFSMPAASCVSSG